MGREVSESLASRWHAGGSVMVTGRSVPVSSGHVPSFVLCGLGAATLLPRAPRASGQTLP